jgi:hypothetical protein
LRFKKRREKKEGIVGEERGKRKRRTETLKLKQTRKSIDTILKTKMQVSNQ